MVATGKNFADALAGSYLAVEKNAPILLTNGNSDNVAQLHEYIAANVEEGGIIYILGGTGAVPTLVEEIKGYDVVRLSGASRYDTNLAILEEAGTSGDSIIVATGKTFADRFRYVTSFNKVANTNIEAVFDSVLKAAVKNNVAQEELPGS